MTGAVPTQVTEPAGTSGASTGGADPAGTSSASSAGSPGSPAPDAAAVVTGLTSAVAAERLRTDGPNAFEVSAARGNLRILAGQFTSPLVLILIAASVISLAVSEATQAAIILLMVSLSGSIGFIQESRSAAAVRALQTRVAPRADVVRDGQTTSILARDVVRGDILALNAGDVVAADARLLAVNHLYLDEAALTGEAEAATKVVRSGTLDPHEPGGREGLVFQGTSVVSGTGFAAVVATGSGTAYGTIARRLAERAPETDFQRGIRGFGILISRTILLLVVGVLVVNVALHRPVLESLLFAIALAVGLTPELLPAIVTLNLTRGARELEAAGVLVKRLPAIQNLGSMTVLCTDKTGTLTEGRVSLERAVDVDGQPAPEALRLAVVNSRLETGFANPLDQAILAASGPADGPPPPKLAELPFDFRRRCLSIACEQAEGPLLIVKGAPDAVLERCGFVRRSGGVVALDEAVRAAVAAQLDAAAQDGLRTIGVATRGLAPSEASSIAAADRDAVEANLTFEGILVFRDPLREGIGATVARLHEERVDLRILTGDDPIVAGRVARDVGLAVTGILSGVEIANLTHDALVARAQTTTIFARVDPDQKLRVIRALRERGAVVGYVGDGINDAPSLHVADVGISVDSATDVARAAADIILLQPSLDAIAAGVTAGRRTFANTLKYIRMGTSSNFGNMLSMAGAALLLPFLPMLPSQILLANLIYDLSQTVIPSDTIDVEAEDEPARWNLRGIERFMIVFGPISSVFDYLTFAALLLFAGENEAVFHTGWFVESLATQILVILAIRTRRIPFWRSRPSRPLLISVVVAVGVAVLLPLSPFATALGFVALPPLLWPVIALYVVLYMALVEVVKRFASTRWRLI